MRSVLGLLCCLTLAGNAAADGNPASTRSEKRTAAKALLVEISSPRSNGEAEGLPDSLARAMETWTGERGEE